MTTTQHNIPGAQRALIVIDIQNDYFSNGKYPLWDAEQVNLRILDAMRHARLTGTKLVLVQHIANTSNGRPAPFFEAGSVGVQIHPSILDAAREFGDDYVIITKQFADSFYQTTLEATLSEWGVKELIVCGMMTQNCVTHTAISKTAEKYDVKVLPDCCTTVDAMLHAIAISALAPRVAMVDLTNAFSV